jgi:uncharacterized repeat protein (TIGR03803 family)
MKPKNLRAALMRTFAVVVVTLMFVSCARAASKYKVLHYFLNKPASSPQAALVADSRGNLYGTTRFSSAGCQCGAVFKLTPKSGGRWSYNVIHLFKGPDGETPVGSLIFDSSGNLYGTTQSGGAHGNGVVFELSPSGSKWTEKILYSFGAISNDLRAPLAALTFDTSGNLYGTASSGGPYLVQGGVFELKPFGKRWKETVIYDFTGGGDGGVPMGNLVWDSAGNLYSTAFNGGDTGFGVVFELSPLSGGNWTESVLYAFTGGEDGEGPQSGVVFDAVGNLYGTTYFNSLDFGAVFELTPSRGSWTLSLPYTFCQKVGCADGATPVASLVVDSAGNLYGTTPQGGADGDGVVFKLSQSGNNWTESVVHSFDGTHGGGPNAALILYKQAIYGTAGFGGVNGKGVAFSLTTGGAHLSLHKND